MAFSQTSVFVTNRLHSRYHQTSCALAVMTGTFQLTEVSNTATGAHKKLKTVNEVRQSVLLFVIYFKHGETGRLMKICY